MLEDLTVEPRSTTEPCTFFPGDPLPFFTPNLISMGSECLGKTSGSYRGAYLIGIISDFSLSWAGFLAISNLAVGTCFLPTLVTAFFFTAAFLSLVLLLFWVSFDLLFVPLSWLWASSLGSISLFYLCGGRVARGCGGWFAISYESSSSSQISTM